MIELKAKMRKNMTEFERCVKSNNINNKSRTQQHRTIWSMYMNAVFTFVFISITYENAARTMWAKGSKWRLCTRVLVHHYFFFVSFFFFLKNWKCMHIIISTGNILIAFHSTKRRRRRRWGYFLFISIFQLTLRCLFVSMFFICSALKAVIIFDVTVISAGIHLSASWIYRLRNESLYVLFSVVVVQKSRP